MFGKPEWFREKAWGWGLVPITREGWIYTWLWTAVMVAPYVVLVSFHRWPESFVWLAASLAALVWDVRQILAAKHPKPAKDVLYIGDEDDSVQTSKLDLRLRR